MKHDFPIFKNNPDLIYLDTAATAQKPQCVIDTESHFYEKQYATVHRGIYRLSENATSLYEQIREKVRHFIHAGNTNEIIFTKGTTESINLVASTFGLTHIQAGDEVILSMAEHHANIVPWQQVCEKNGAKLVIIPLLENGELDFDAYLKLLNINTKFVAVTHISNVLGIVNPIKKMIQAAHEKNIPVLVDGAQAIAHIPVNVVDLDCDFYVFSAHKLYGPTGVGILYGKEKQLEKMPPYQMGGHMIRQVTFAKTEWNDLPNKFEAGTPNIAGAIGLGAAIDYVSGIGDRGSGIGVCGIERNGSAAALDRESKIHQEEQLLNYALSRLHQIPGLTIYGTSSNKIGVISFSMDCAHPHDVATILDQHNIAVRAGHHCAMPLMDYLNVPALTRISFGLYTELPDIDAFIEGLKKVRTIFHD